MARSRKPRISLESRRGVVSPEDCCNSWDMQLIQVPGRIGPVDLDEIVNRLIEHGLAGETRRDLGAELHAGKVPTPSGQWALLVTMPGQPWAYFVPGVSLERADPLERIASEAGLRTIQTGYSDFSSCTSFACQEGEETLIYFESCNLEDEVVEAYTGGFDELFTKTIFRGSRLTKKWLETFDSPFKAQDALACAFDAFIPYIAAGGYEDVITLSGFDDREFNPEDYLRIDLVGFGNARLEPSPADIQFREALESGDLDALRAAAAAGADLTQLAARPGTPLQAVLSARYTDHAQRRALIATLLDLGVDPSDPLIESPVHTLLEPLMIDEAKTIDLLELILARGANVNALGGALLNLGQTPLHVVARRGWLAIAKYLVSRGANVHATDLKGQTPRQAAATAAEAVAEYFQKESDVKHKNLITFLIEAEQGGAPLDWKAEAEAATRRETRRKREMKLAFGKIKTGFESLGKLQPEEVSAEHLAEAATYVQPDEIHLHVDESEWASESARAQTAATLEAEGFERINRYQIPELPNIRVEAYLHATHSLYAALYDVAGQTVLDLVRYHRDRTKLTVTNNAASAETHIEMPSNRTLRRLGASPIELIRAIHAEAIPAAGPAPVTADEFARRFEKDYRREIKARKRAIRRGGRP